MMSVIQRTHAPYQPSNQAIKVTIKIQGCEQGVIEEEDIYKNRGPPNLYQKYKRFRLFLFQQFFVEKEEIPPERMSIRLK